MERIKNRDDKSHKDLLQGWVETDLTEKQIKAESVIPL
jgi:hypothetical protein